MRRLLLLRHAKSSWADPGVRDHDRPLNDRGRRAAAAMGDRLRALDLLPDLVLCSSARRTCETLAGLRLPDATPIDVDHALYLADPDTVLERVRRIDPAVSTLLVIGHNPTTQDLALDLAGRGDRDDLFALGAKFPTGALAVLAWDGPWTDIAPGSATLERFVTPRALDDSR